MNTKERILHEALTQFADKGYSAVYLAEIASAVGIKTPSLYKHYKSKQDIFDSCVEMFYLRMKNIRNELRLPGSETASFSYSEADESCLVKIANSLFMFFWKDKTASEFRKLLMNERYHNAQLNELYESLFIDGAIAHEEKIFAELTKAGVLVNTDPHILATRFYSPIYFLLQKYDMRPNDEAIALRELDDMVLDFCQAYKERKAQ